jgi:hypothetical protein
MRRIIEYTLISLDGVFAGPGISEFMGYREEAYLRDGLGQLLACDGMLMGRTTYENFAKIWAGRAHPWADRRNSIKKYFFSTALTKSGMVRIWRFMLAAQIVLSIPATAQSVQASGSLPPLIERQKEIAMALSACPPAVASKAAVYVLDISGYVKVRDSQNGFTAIVQHSLPTSREPQCMDAEGTRTILPRMLKVAELRAQGRSSEEIKRFVADALAKGIFQPPTRPGIDYMLSTENLVPDDKGVVSPFPPHGMFYAPYLTNADLGSEGQAGGGPAFVASAGTPYALIIVPVGGAPNGPPHKHPGDLQ